MMMVSLGVWRDATPGNEGLHCRAECGPYPAIFMPLINQGWKLVGGGEAREVKLSVL